MRTALCLFGKVGGTEGKDNSGGPVDFALCSTHYKKHIIEPNNCDVFMHCWDGEHEQKLVELYKPKKSMFDMQLPLLEKTVNNERVKINGASLRAYCRWYSTKKVIELKQQYEKENNFKYDWVMLGRYDLMFLVDFDFSKLGDKKFYAAIWNDPPLAHSKNGTKWISKPNRVNKSLSRTELADLWFVMRSDIADEFGKCYDILGELCQPSGHCAAWLQAHIAVGPPRENIGFIFYRWWDFELYRWKVCSCYR